MRSLLLLLYLGVVLSSASAGTHSLRYFYTAVSGDIDFPEFTAVGLVDGGQFMYFDSNTKTAVPKTKWIRQNEGADYWDRQTQGLIGTHQVFKNNIQTAKERFNQTKSTGVHSLQKMYGCELDDDGAKRGFYQYGYDGEDFIALDQKTLTWTAANPQALITKHKWDPTPFATTETNYLNNICIEWLQKYVNYGRETLERKVSPEVSLLQKDPSSPVECHATGFHPRQVMVSWQKNGQDLSEDVELRETLQNEDGTFQKSSVLSVKPEEWNKKPEVYSCVVQHGGKDIIVRLNAKNIKTNYSSNNMGIIIGIVVAAVVLIAAAVGFVMWKKSKSGYGKTSTSETDSENSDRPMQKA